MAHEILIVGLRSKGWKRTRQSGLSPVRLVDRVQPRTQTSTGRLIKTTERKGYAQAALDQDPTVHIDRALERLGAKLRRLGSTKKEGGSGSA